MLCYLSAISFVLIGHQTNFVDPFVPYISLFVACYYDLCRIGHLGLNSIFVCEYSDSNLIDGCFFLKSLTNSSNSCSEPAHMMYHICLSIYAFICAFIYAFI